MGVQRALAILMTCLPMLLAGACDEKSDPAPAGEAPAAGSESSASGLVMAEQTFTYEVQRNADQRKLIMVARGKLPKGWAPDAKATSGKLSKTLLPPRKEGDNPFSLSNVTLSATCHGQCTADKFPGNIKGAAAQQVKFAGADARVIKDEVIRPGVTGFVIEIPRPKGKAYTIGVSHWQPGWPHVFFCNAHFQNQLARDWGAIYEACSKLEVQVNDPLMPADVLETEAAKLAKCPETSSLTYVPDAPREGDPTTFGDVKAVYAHASRPGSVGLYLANFDMKTTRFRESPLTGEQRVLKFWFSAANDGEILSGSYAVKPEEGKARVSPGLAIAEGRTLQWSSHRTEGGVEIIARTPDTICGKISVKGGQRGTLAGEFIADLELGSSR